MHELNITNWKRKKTTLLNNFAELSENDLILVNGNENEVIKRIGERLHITIPQARRIIRLA